MVGALVALPALRLPGIYLALATAAFAVFLDRWLFTLPAFDLGPLHDPRVRPRGRSPVKPLDVPGIDTHRRPTRLVVLSVIFALHVPARGRACAAAASGSACWP